MASIRYLPLLILSLPLSPAQTSARTLDRGLCDPGKTVYLACQTTQSRWISVCGSTDALQYRFGRRGRVELQLPERAEDGPTQLQFAHYFRAQVERTELRFMAHDRDYVIFDHRGETGRRAGMRVSTEAGQPVEFACSGSVFSRLSTLRDLLPCDQDSALNGGLCPDQATSKPGK